jgi:hypothetical protein
MTNLFYLKYKYTKVIDLKMPTFSGYKEQIDQIRKLGECLKGGEFIESPFDIPIEEEQRGDPDKTDDDQNFLSEQNDVKSLEQGLVEGKKDIKSITYKPKLVYFLDGSLRTKYLGEYIEGERGFCILSSEVSCAVVKKNVRSLEPFRIEKKLVFIFPHKDTGLISDTLFERLKRLDEIWGTQNNILRIGFLMKKEQKISDVRYSMEGKARHIMHTLELQIAEDFERGSDWLVMDGAIRKEEFLDLKNTIGLAKSFSRNPRFDLGDGKPLMISRYLSKIREGERSAVFKKIGENNVAFCYVRLRVYPPMEPLGGLIKIDFKLDEDELSADKERLIDEISAEVYALRSPSVYPLPRWPSMIYPIRMTELMMRSIRMNNEIIGYYSRELKNMIQEGVISG